MQEGTIISTAAAGEEKQKYPIEEKVYSIFSAMSPVQRSRGGRQWVI